MPISRAHRLLVTSLLAAGILTLGASVNGIASVDETLRAGAIAPAPVYDDTEGVEVLVGEDCPDPVILEPTDDEAYTIEREI